VHIHSSTTDQIQAAQSRVAASVGHRPGGDGALGHGGCVAGHRHRLRRRRIEFCRHRLSLHRQGLQGKAKKPRIIAVEPAACPSLTRGKYAYDFGDTGHMTPLVKMHTLGSSFTPPGFHTGGLRYHGMSALVSHLKELGEIEAVAYQQRGCFDAAVQFARCEGIVPAPEATHAVKAATEEALRCKRDGRAETILFNLSGHGHFDMAAYIDYFSGKLQDVTYDESELVRAMADLPQVAA
jgi:tryptophan synthase beta chain